jgi:pimeloyl-ACP methyl ester carboxylesterase
MNSTPSQQTNSKPGYRLDTDSSHVFLLPDGRKLGYAEYGSPTGHAILYHHGLPGSRLEAAAYHDLALSLGARIIAIDRPGIGWSSPHPSRTLLSWAKDVENLTQHLCLEKYAVMGVSGGGPYALACAAALPSAHLKCVSVICGLGPPDMSMWQADWAHWLSFPYGWRFTPTFLIEWYFSLDAFGRMDLSDEQRLEKMLEPSRLAAIKDPKDRAILGDENAMRLAVRASREAQAQGFEGVALDGRVMCRNWGFRIQDVRRDLPVQLWYGQNDKFIPPNHGVETAARLGGAAAGNVILRLEDDTHYSISQNWRREQLEAILAEIRK